MATSYGEKNVFYNDKLTQRTLNLIVSHKLMNPPLTRPVHEILENLESIEHLVTIIDPPDPTNV